MFRIPPPSTSEENSVSADCLLANSFEGLLGMQVLALPVVSSSEETTHVHCGEVAPSCATSYQPRWHSTPPISPHNRSDLCGLPFVVAVQKTPTLLGSHLSSSSTSRVGIRFSQCETEEEKRTKLNISSAGEEEAASSCFIRRKSHCSMSPLSTSPTTHLHYEESPLSHRHHHHHNISRSSSSVSLADRRSSLVHRTATTAAAHADDDAATTSSNHLLPIACHPVTQSSSHTTIVVDTKSTNPVAVGGDVISEEDPPCLLYTSDAADEEDSVDLGGRRIIKKKKKNKNKNKHYTTKHHQTT
eukprot:TRINITY_DN18570_c0_g1_i5.p1 TRINITY_DN18570_c0_g1~~TRINITY_DN18570_c0_g1_i5.p1  ORF type:complete len:301 (-),score=29.91 TRINITY_DN18570_c0_g1_i5:69-971(-)